MQTSVESINYLQIPLKLSIAVSSSCMSFFISSLGFFFLTLKLSGTISNQELRKSLTLSNSVAVFSIRLNFSFLNLRIELVTVRRDSWNSYCFLTERFRGGGQMSKRNSVFNLWVESVGFDGCKLATISKYLSRMPRSAISLSANHYQTIKWDGVVESVWYQSEHSDLEMFSAWLPLENWDQRLTDFKANFQFRSEGQLNKTPPTVAWFWPCNQMLYDASDPHNIHRTFDRAPYNQGFEML